MSAPIDADSSLEAFLASTCEELGVPGAVAGIVHDGHQRAAAHGVTSVRDPLPVDHETLFMIGSTTKTLTATAVLSLVDDGALRLNDRVADHLPGFRVADAAASAAVTVQQLLNHTAGWRGDTMPKPDFGDGALARAVIQMVDNPQDYPPGEHVSYNNASLLVAGHLLAEVAGKPFEAAVTERVLEPLGMAATYFHPWESAQRRAAVGHLTGDAGARPVHDWPLPRGIGPAGGALSSLRDQLSYMAYHLDGTTPGRPPLREETRLLMQKRTADCRSTLTGVGLSWLLSDYGGLQMMAHGGNVSNLQTSTFHLLPEVGLGVTVMGNCREGALLGKQVLDWAVEHYLDRPRRPGLPVHELTPALISDYVGAYDLGLWSLDVTSTGDKLFVQMVLPPDADEQLRAAFAAPRTEMVLVGTDQLGLAPRPLEAVADFVRDGSGRVAWLRHGMRMATKRGARA